MLTAATLCGAQYISIYPTFWTGLTRKMGDCAYGLFMSHFAMLMLFNCMYPALKGLGIPLAVWLLAIFVCCNALGWFIWRYIEGPARHTLFTQNLNKTTHLFL